MHKVLIVTERFWPEDFIINDLAAGLVASGVSVTVLTQQPSYPKGMIFNGYKNRMHSREVWNGVKILRFKTILGYRESLFCKLFNYLWFVVCGSFNALFLLPPFDSVLIYQTGPLTMAVPGILAAKVRRKPIAIWTQDVWPDSVYAYGIQKTRMLSWFLDAFVRWVYRSVDAIMISCRGFKEILENYSDKPLIYAPNWPMTPYEAGHETPGRVGIPIFLFAGNIGKVQNLENVIRGFARAFKQDPELGRLRIVGDGSALESLQKLASDLGVPVEFPGRKSASDMGEEYDRAQFLILPLADKPVFRLTVPAKFQMYLSVGKPILCAAAGEVARQVRESVLGVVSDPNDPADIARGFLALRTAAATELAQWSVNASTTLKSEFDRETIIGSIWNVLEGL